MHTVFKLQPVYTSYSVLIPSRNVNSRLDLTKMNIINIANFDKKAIVRGTGLEPARPYGHYHLKVACLPISTPAQRDHINTK